MYRKLEPKNEKMEAVDRQAEAVCGCQCKSAQTDDDAAKPEANLTGVKLAVDYTISG